MKYHCSYEKYFYKQNIPVIRVRCGNDTCGITHALIPAFSVPGCSIGTMELDTFISLRSQGKTVGTAGQCFVDAGMSGDYPEEIHKRLKTRGRVTLPVVFGAAAGPIGDYILMILRVLRHLKLPPDQPAASLNAACLSFRCNPVLFSRLNILIFPQNIPRSKFSLNTPSPLPP